jgi:chromosome segregation ATPase
MSASQQSDGKKRITKLEKIAQLESKIKILKEENQRLKESKTPDGFSPIGAWGGDGDKKSVTLSPSKQNGDVEKLKEALKALKRVTVKQEMTLTNLRQKAKQRRQELDHKDKIIKELQAENKSFRIAHEKIRDSEGDDVLVLKGKIADLQLKLAREQTSKEEQNRQLKQSQEGISSLQLKLATIQGGRGVSRNSSSASIGSSASFLSDGTSGEDLIRLKQELARKAEKIANLQHDLELAKDEIHDLKQRSDFKVSFPLTPAPGSDDFFETDDDDEDFWGK